VLTNLRAIATLPFSGDTRRGPRHTYIIKKLLRYGCNPLVDRHGNIWVERERADGRGKGRSQGPVILISSHLDVDPRVRDLSFSAYREGNRRFVSGVLDNAAGCCLNLSLAAARPRRGRAIHVFTASEEINRDNPRRFCRSAREVVRELRQEGITPDFAAVIDVTFPRIIDPKGKIDWQKPYQELFDQDDRTHCYLDGYSRRKEKELVQSLLRRSKDHRIGLRYFHGHDEAFIYGRLCHAFAFGPVVFGDFAHPGQRMPLAHLETSLRFLKGALGYAR
jgi:putative aminopeptidase FrvX